ncbi:acyltransferase domain-containing protein [Streptomyces sp. NBC_00201]|uniref:acyltransferase domain-containing protein n=1 Tax=Streptomyces sp. NBC_00201 TaxID=2975679 RepID=UPI00224E2AB3|nr:acyltransferase domain-containing protein [Streptomyces sp. NBC_00201]MCX5249977.1 acyltransferase domain-containing protein [Streptomyces sp. NBC_00201]
MPLTADSAVIRRLMVCPGPAGEDRAPVPASAAAVSAVLRAFGRAPRDLPVRTVVYVGAHAPDPGLAPEHEGFAVRTASAPGRALRLAHEELHSGIADFALVAGFDEPEPGTIAVYALRRAAEAVADGDTVIGVLDLAGPADPDASPPLKALRHGHRATDPAHHRLLLWSGRDERDEQRVRGELLPLLSGLHHEGFPALPTMVPCGSAPGPVRGAVVTVAALSASAVHKAKPVTVRTPRSVALLFPGQGSQHHAMAAGLYGREPVFTAAFDAALSHMGDEGPRIRADWLTRGRPLIPVDDVRRAQPLLFAVDYALGRMVIGWGVRPTAVLGHSAGELVAATIAGAVALPDAVAMVLERVRQAVKIPAGGMLAVAADERRLRPYLRDDVAIAAVNANQQTMLAGSAEPLAEIAERLRADGLTVVTVPATSPFHSPAMAPASEAVEAAYRDIPLRQPTLPLYSGYTGELLGPDEALSPRFWARQITDTVYFKQALESLLAADDMLLIEAGPRQTLTAFARRHRAVRLGASAAIPLLPGRPGTAEADRQSVLTAAARLWTEGHVPDLVALSGLWTWSGSADVGREDTPAVSTPRLAAARTS